MPTRNEYVASIFEASQVIKRTFLQDMKFLKKEGSLTHSQLIVLMMLEQHGAMGIKHLAKILGISSSAATQLVDTLTKTGYVLRKNSPNDRRSVTITLSTKSKKNIDRIHKEILKKYAHLFQSLSDGELKQYAELNKKLALSLSKNTLNELT